MLHRTVCADACATVENTSQKCQRNHQSVSHAAIRKYGAAAFDMHWLSHATNLKELDALEQHFIALHNTQVPNGYNRTAGGAGFNGRHTDATRQKMRQSQTGKKQSTATKRKRSDTLKALWKTEAYKGRNKGRTGKKASALTRQRQSAAIKKHWEKRRGEIGG